MSDQNPYEAPAANVETISSGGTLTGAKSVSIGRGAAWFGGGWELFKRDPWVWIGLIVIYFVVFIIMSIIPILSAILPTLMTPIFTAGVMQGCHDLDEGNRLDVAHLFAGFKRRTGELIGLGAISFGLYILVAIVVFGTMYATGMLDGLMSGMMEGDPVAHESPQMMASMALPILVGLLFIFPIMMLFWFSPAILILNQNVGIVESMKLSFMGCIKNILPLILYGIIALLLMFIAAIPIFLGFLVLFPVLFATVYVSYKDIYLD